MILNGTAGINLQSTLSGASSAVGSVVDGKHHPITCADELEFDDDGLRCPHASVPADDQRTQDCVDHSVAILLLELARQRFG